AAVAAGLCYATVDTDAIGSGRLPAAICGVTCHKPTFGLLSTAGVLAGEKADPAILLLSHPCVTARGVEDVALVLDALTNTTKGDATSGRYALQGPLPVRRVGVATNFAADEEVKAAFRTFLASIRPMGINTNEIKVPF